MDRKDVAVVGAGFGGLGAALSLAERGAEVALFERLTYPGGCASTFERNGWKFESGATLFAGLADHQLFGRWIDRHDMDVEVRLLDPVVEMRTDEWELTIPASREQFVARATELPGVEAESVRELFDHQLRIADALWRLFDDDDLLPPFGLRELGTHLKRSPQYLGLLRWMGRPLTDFLAKYGADEGALRDYFDAVSQITVQLDASRAEAPFALAATDYFFRGAGHVDGGIGELAEGCVDAIGACGGAVHMADPVGELRREDGGWHVASRRREVRADRVVAGVPPGVVLEMIDDEVPTEALEAMNRDVRTGWGAAMLYLGLCPDADLPDSPHHFQAVADTDRSMTEGNHVFCSVAGMHERGRSPDGQRVATCSTHVDLGELLELDQAGRADRVETIQRRMRETLERRVPEVADAIVMEMTASPRTFERFTGRPDGFVGGVPRRRGWHNYTGLRPTAVAPGLHLVGDSVFPGQSTLACAVGGRKVADQIERETGGWEADAAS